MPDPNTETLKALWRWDVQPQVASGNDALAAQLSNTINMIDPSLTDAVMGSLAAPDTAALGVQALTESVGEKGAGQVLDALSPFIASADYFAFKSPGIDFSPSLIDADKIKELSTQLPTPQAVASRLFEDGELASAEAVAHIAKSGEQSATKTAALVEQFRTALRDLNHAEVKVIGNTQAAALRLDHPALEGQPLLTAHGVIQGGIWRPQVDAFALGTPAQQQLLGLLNSPRIKAELAKSGIQGVEPVPLAGTMPEPGARPTLPPKRSIQELESDPKFQALKPEVQAAVRKQFFNANVATSDAGRQLARQNPEAMKAARAQYEGSFVTAARELPYVGRIAGQAADVAAQAGSTLIGATEGLVPPGVTEQARGLLGRRGVSEGIGRIGSDVASMAAAGPFLGPALLEGARGGARGAYEGAPLVNDSIANLAKESVPIVGKPATSIVSKTARGALGSALLAKGIGLIGTSVKAAAGAIPIGVKEIVRDFFVKGKAVGNSLFKLEEAAQNSNQSINQYIAEKLMNRAPTIITKDSGKTIVTMKDGRVISQADLAKEVQDALEKMQTAPTFHPPFAAPFELEGVQSIEGVPLQVNNIFRMLGSDLKVVGQRAAKRTSVVPNRGKWDVVQDGPNGPIVTTYKTSREAQYHVDNLPLPPTRIEDDGFKAVVSQGQNPFFLTAHVEDANLNKYIGELPKMPQYSEVAMRLTHHIAIPKERMARIEARGGAPLYSQIYQPMELAMTRKNAFMAPHMAEMNNLIKDLKLRTDPRLEGYTTLMSTKPGTQEWEDVIQQFNLDEVKGKGIRDWFLNVAKDFGIDGEEFLTEVIPRVKRMGDLHKAFPSGNLPKSAHFFAEDILNGAFPVAARQSREWDIRTMMTAFLTQGAFKHYVGKEWENAVKLTDLLTTRTSEWLAAEQYLRAVKGWGSEMDEELMKAVGQALQRLRYGNDFTPTDATQAGKRAFAGLMSTSYSTYFTARPSAVMRQFLQTALNIMPRFGNGTTVKAINELRINNKAAWETVARSGALTEQPFNETEIMGLNVASTMFQRADSYQRAISAKAQELLFDNHITRYLSTRTPAGWADFAKKSKLNLYSLPQQQEFKRLIDAGKVYEAKLSVMKAGAESTNWVYSYQNRPYALTGLSGRLFGQFGVYPAYFREYVTQMMTRGDKADRAAWIGRFVMNNFLVGNVMREVFGADMSNYLWMQPLPYAGGPLATQAYNTIQAAREGPMQAYYQKQANPLRFVWKNFLPYGGLIDDVSDTLNAKTGEDAFREFFINVPKAKE